MMDTPQRSLDAVYWMMPQKALAHFYMVAVGEFGSKWVAEE
tara:strand:+ start:651 stop:773 length:123 start_codon:yes stop_codon:yes gene_type:complete